MIEFDIKTETL